MIPKVINYIWFGGNPLPELAIKCIKSWEEVLPEYKIIRWDESNFDINSNQYVKEAYEAKKYAFVSDYVRLYALFNYGGIYMDTDVEVLKPLDKFLEYDAFSGFENETFIPTGIMACKKGFEGFGDLLQQYGNRRFIKEDGTYDVTTNVTAITEYYSKKGLMKNDTEQLVEGFKIMPSIVFCPAKEDINPKYIDKIVTIHHKSGSWLSIEEKRNRNSVFIKTKLFIKRSIKKIIGRERYGDLLRFINKYRKIKTFAQINDSKVKKSKK
jgi:mannosyltransferase OCH1-like enzyme